MGSKVRVTDTFASIGIMIDGSPSKTILFFFYFITQKKQKKSIVKLSASLTCNSKTVVTSTAMPVVFETPILRRVFSSDVANGQCVRTGFINRNARWNMRSNFSRDRDIIPRVCSLPVHVCVQVSFTRKLDRLSDLHCAVEITIRLR